MKLGIMQPYFFPYIGYWQLIHCVDQYVIYDDVNFIKNGWINRNRILLNGEPHMINLPMEGASSNKLINEINVSTNQTVRLKTVKCIENAYRKAPYFNKCMQLVEEIMNDKTNNLASFLFNNIQKTCEYLEIKTNLILSSMIQKNNELKGQDKVIEINQSLGASEYVNAIGGIELYSKETFKNQGITLNFLKTNIKRYQQYKNEFVGGLSIIDVMMFNSVDEIKDMLNNYELV